MFQQVYELITVSDIFEKKDLIKNIYSKYFIRKIRNKKFKSSVLVDNGWICTSMKKKARLFEAKKFGGSIVGLKLQVFSSKFNSNASFKMLTPFNQRTSFFSKKLASISFKKKQPALVRTLGPKRGGFSCFSSFGVRGFMPTNTLTAFVLAEEEIFGLKKPEEFSWMPVRFKKVQGWKIRNKFRFNSYSPIRKIVYAKKKKVQQQKI